MGVRTCMTETNVGLGEGCKIRKAKWPVCNKKDDLAS